MKKIFKLFIDGKPMNEIYPHATGWQVFKYRCIQARRAVVRLVMFLGIFTSTAAIIGSIAFSHSTITYAEKDVPVEVVHEAPVLDRIADCESGNGTPGSAHHYKNGQVIMRANTNGTIDIGKYQVNLTYWGKQASALGFDLTKEADNKAMAEWIYANKGTGDWSSSAHCWQK